MDRNSSALVSYFLPTVRGLYLLTTVVLLLNLLIAMFNSTITKMEERSERLWYLYRRNVILENWNRSPFPFAPFLLVEIIVSWIRKCKCFKSRPTFFRRNMLSAEPVEDDSAW